MRVFVTGSSGFLGSWICRVLSAGHEVIALVRPSSDTYRLTDIDGLQIERRESDGWAGFISAEKPDVLILADWWGVGNHDRNDARQFENIERMEIIAVAARDAGVGLVIGVGSQAELGPVSNRITEDLPDNPTTEYGKAKVTARKIIQSSLVESKTRFAWLRIFSTYGPCDTDTWLIPQLIDTLTKGEVMNLTKGEQEWSYLHAFDLARAFEAVIESEAMSGVVNVGNPQTVILKEAVHVVADQLGAQGLLGFGNLAYRPDQVMKLEPACESLTSIGWKPIVSFENGIAQTIQWRHRETLTPLHCEDGQEVVFTLPSRR
ncbi:MAG: NAD(P)-dependent oxidoreductase [Candidatus Planktophila sp.]|nr:NAD(P)-dependent oxidoreductase [Candidatus Planktophila sp.]